MFFKALKQNLRVKTFVGTTENALYIQIWTALIAVLLIKFMRFKAAIAWSLSNLVAFLRWNLFTYRGLWEWLDRPEDPRLLSRRKVNCLTLGSWTTKAIINGNLANQKPKPGFYLVDEEIDIKINSDRTVWKMKLAEDYIS